MRWITQRRACSALREAGDAIGGMRKNIQGGCEGGCGSAQEATCNALGHGLDGASPTRRGEGLSAREGYAVGYGVDSLMAAVAWVAEILGRRAVGGGMRLWQREEVRTGLPAKGGITLSEHVKDDSIA